MLSTWALRHPTGIAVGLKARLWLEWPCVRMHGYVQLGMGEICLAGGPLAFRVRSLKHVLDPALFIDNLEGEREK